MENKILQQNEHTFNENIIRLFEIYYMFRLGGDICRDI